MRVGASGDCRAVRGVVAVELGVPNFAACRSFGRGGISAQGQKGGVLLTVEEIKEKKEKEKKKKEEKRETVADIGTDTVCC